MEVDSLRPQKSAGSMQSFPILTSWPLCKFTMSPATALNKMNFVLHLFFIHFPQGAGFKNPTPFNYY